MFVSLNDTSLAFETGLRMLPEKVHFWRWDFLAKLSLYQVIAIQKLILNLKLHEDTHIP